MLDHAQAEYSHTFTAVVVLLLGDWMLSSNQNTYLPFIKILVSISSGYQVLEIANT